MIQSNEIDLLQACLEIVRRGGVVHIQDGRGALQAVLHQPERDGVHWARELANRIEHSRDYWRFQEWRRYQEYHAWSLVFRQGICGDFQSHQKRLMSYLVHFLPELDTKNELHWLRAQILAWMQATIDTEGLQPLARTLRNKYESLETALLPALIIPLLWAYVRWRRMTPDASYKDRTHFFELKSASTLHAQFESHIEALRYTYQHVGWDRSDHLFHRSGRSTKP
ncbi:MAG: hypothetical protein WCX93_00230 [Burkholderiaceae bacterium]